MFANYSSNEASSWHCLTQNSLIYVVSIPFWKTQFCLCTSAQKFYLPLKVRTCIKPFTSHYIYYEDSLFKILPFPEVSKLVFSEGHFIYLFCSEFYFWFLQALSKEISHQHLCSHTIPMKISLSLANRCTADPESNKWVQFCAVLGIFLCFPRIMP